MPVARLVNVINLGRMGFMAANSVQQKCARQILDGMNFDRARQAASAGENFLLLVEHNPVFTVGLRAGDYSEKVEQDLKDKGAEFYRTNRGGLITYHGPGQLVAYPIINLKNFFPSMKWYIEKLEKTMIKTCKHFELDATTTENTGVWVDERKIGAIGVHCSRYVTTHGVSLNCNTDLSWYNHIVPCGLEGKEVTSLSKELQQPVTIADTIAPFLDAFQQEFQCHFGFSYLEDADMELITSGNDKNFSAQPQKVSATQRPMW